MKKTDCHVYPFVKAVYWWFLIVYILIVRTRVPYYIGIKWYYIITCILFSSLTFQIHIHIHIFSSEVTCYFCYFCYRLTILLPLNCVPTQPLLRRDVSGAASGRSHRYVVTQFQMHLEGVKNTENAGCNPERRTFRFVKYLSIVYGIVNFLPVCASTV